MSGRTVAVGYATASGTATAGVDYASASGTLIVPPGAAGGTLAVPVYGDIVDEDDETFTVALSAPVGATLAKAQGLGTITDDDPPPSISIGDAGVAEGDGGVVPALFDVTLSAPSSRTITVAWAASPGTATPGDDYVELSGQLTFAPGTASRTIVVPVKGDYASEADETFFVSLASPANATIGAGQGTGTILDDDQMPALSIGDARVSGGADAVFTVSLTEASASSVTVDYATADGTARAGSDYVASSGTVAFAPGATTATLAVQVIGDAPGQGNEAFVVGLSNPVNAKIARAQGQGVIVDAHTKPEACTPIVTVPFTIALPGRYCLAGNRVGPVPSGSAITVDADDVTVDLRRFTIRNTFGASTLAYGVHGAGRQNVTVRNGTVQGFYVGVYLGEASPFVAPQGQLVSRLKAFDNLYAGIWVEGRGSLASHNQVAGTHGTAAFGADADAFGIVLNGPEARGEGNTVSQTLGTGAGTGYAIGVMNGDGTRISRNRARNTLLGGTGVQVTTSTGAGVDANKFTNLSYGIVFAAGATGTYRGNVMRNVTTPYVGGTPGP